MQPINFDAHCKACHPLNVDAGTPELGIVKYPPLPHRKQPDELRPRR